MADKNYTEYDALELAQDAGFIRWVRGGDAATAAFWDRWTADHPERAAVVAEARRLVEALRFTVPAPAPERVEGLWSRISEEIDRPAEPVREAKVRRLRRLGYAAAACAAALLFFYLWSGQGWEKIATGPGELLAYVLPDSSVIELNANTTVRYRPDRWMHERRVRLAGEAFFEVVKGPAFTVETDEGTVTVLGTSFNVLARGRQFVVDCVTGRVGVALRGAAETAVLTPGRGARLIPQAEELTTYDFDPAAGAAWRQSFIYYQDEPLQIVFRRLEQQFGVEVDYPEVLGSRTVNGFFSATNLDSALYDVTYPLNLDFRREGEKVVITE